MFISYAIISYVMPIKMLIYSLFMNFGYMIFIATGVTASYVQDYLD